MLPVPYGPLAERCSRGARCGYARAPHLRRRPGCCRDPRRGRPPHAGAAIAAERGATVVPPYDHPHVIAGQGTAALELLEDVGPVDVLVTPLGGGGLLSGTILAARELAPGARIYGVEPEAGDDARCSLAQGRIVRIDTPVTLADGAQTQALGELTFPILRGGVEEVVTATDDELVEAMRLVAGTLKQVVEPTGVLGLAGLLSGAVPVRPGERVGVVLTGGNVEPARYAQLLGVDDGSARDPSSKTGKTGSAWYNRSNSSRTDER
ncbi:pyridoxal-phosphate dependent enzyme [Serinicoccus sp. CUA-874]|uniref:pyridoxal-phosphate dependent enzyme n=1 Tax=Serinicoccus sp. CUA-874 TaxID=1517939 RepID=UPI0022A9E599|nr:pyridoxal-phosphate dependent enzyme [Serinicoccus sp. CUA-874]